MTRVFRLLRQPFAAQPFDGEGSYRYGGRWSSPGTRLVYTSEHLSLAMLEYLVHLDPERPPADLVLAAAELPEDLARETISEASLGPEWREFPAPASLATVGDTFVREGRVPLLAVPSALVRGERNWLLNPAHPEFARIRVLPPEPFLYDPRLLRRRTL